MCHLSLLTFTDNPRLTQPWYDLPKDMLLWLSLSVQYWFNPLCGCHDAYRMVKNFTQDHPHPHIACKTLLGYCTSLYRLTCYAQDYNDHYESGLFPNTEFSPAQMLVAAPREGCSPATLQA